jgi:hypothetical protein
MKALFTVAILVLTFVQSARADEVRHFELCGVPTLPYGCNEDVCVTRLKTELGVYELSVDSDSLLRTSDLVAIAKSGGVQCFYGYQIERTFKVERFAD